MAQRKRILLDLEPLSIAISLKVATTGSPLTQAYDAESGEYVPDRGLTPTVIIPVVALNAADGSMSTAYGNDRLAQMVWYAGGEDITTQSAWAGKYEITSEGDEKGALTIYRNLSVGEQIPLHFEAVVNDSRTSLNYPVVSEDVILSTTDVGGVEGYSLSFDDDTVIGYDPILDNLFEYEYKVAHGIISDTSAGRDEATDNHSYRRTIDTTLYFGRKEYDGAWSIKLYRVSWSNKEMILEEVSDADENEFEEITSSSFTMNLLMIDKQEYLVKAFVDGEEVDAVQFAVRRKRRPYNVSSMNGSSRKPTDTVRRDKAVIAAGGKLLEYGESIIKIIWKTDTANTTDVTHGEGRTVEYDIDSTGAGSTPDDGWIEQYFETSYKDVHAIATETDGTVYTDENGLILIFN